MIRAMLANFRTKATFYLIGHISINLDPIFKIKVSQDLYCISPTKYPFICVLFYFFFKILQKWELFVSQHSI